MADTLTLDRDELAAAGLDDGRTPPAPPEPVSIDTEAPYGRKADGSPRRSNGGRRGGASSGGKAPRAPRARPAPSAGRAGGSTRAGRHRDAVAGILQGGAALASVFNPVDAIVLETFALPFGEAVQRAADQHPELARFLDKMGGGSALVEVAIMAATMVGLIACNHGALKGSPIAPMMEARLAEIVAAKMPPAPPPGVV